MTQDRTGWVPSFRKGHEFKGPDGKGYRLTCDAYPTDPVKVGDLEPFRGAPECKAGEMFPRWLAAQLYRTPPE